MKTKNFLYLLTALLLLLTAPITVSAETADAPEDGRNIYAGDIITLEIAAGGISSEDLREKFSDFEIVELKETDELYLLSIRTFEPGEYSVLLGDKEIVITVASTLDDIDRDDIFEGGAQVMEPGFTFHWRILFYIAAGVFGLSGGSVMLKIILKKRVKLFKPYQLFLQRSNSLATENDNYFVDLTRYFKEYIESLYQCRIIGKTSLEIINKLKKIQPLEIMLSDIEEWLTECDSLKFTGVRVSNEKKREHYEKLLDLVKKIDLQKMDTQKEGAA